jgi:SAM-dependent methyltransferase
MCTRLRYGPAHHGQRTDPLRYRRRVSAKPDVRRAPQVGFAATLGRSTRLFRAFLHEQDDPDGFYTELARDSAAQVDHWQSLRGALLLDVGGGPGYFAEAFEARGATYVALDADAGEMRLHGRQPGPRTALGRGDALPFAEGAFDIAYSSNVLEHLREPWRTADEMVRVTRPGGLVAISYTLWWGPWGGHETSPWHFLGGHRARERYRRRHGRDPKNVYGESLFKTTASEGRRWATERADVEVMSIEPRYLPAALKWVGRTPLLREVASWNILLLLRKRSP